MQPIAVLQIGEAGIRMGNAGWEVLAREHSFGYDGSKINQEADEMIGTFFQERRTGNYRARSLQVDRGETVIEQVRNGHLNGLFGDDTFAFAQEQIVENALEKLRRLTERQEKMQGFMLIAGLGGNTGSMSAQMVQRLSTDYPKYQRMGFCLFPDQESPPRQEYLNAATAIGSLTQNLDMGIAIEQSALTRICNRNLAIQHPTHSDRNSVFASLFSSVTATHRLQSSHSPDMQQLMTILVPYPKLNFMIPSISPLSRVLQPYIAYITLAAFSPANCLVDCDFKLSRFMATSLLFRGNVTPKDVSISLCRIKEKRIYKFVDWVPTGTSLRISYRGGPSIGLIKEPGKSLCMLSNSTAYLDLLERLKLGVGERAKNEDNESLEQLMYNYTEIEAEQKKDQAEVEQS